MSIAKIHLSAEELQLVQNAQLLLTKNSIIEKVYALFGELAEEQVALFNAAPALLPTELLQLSPKIARGEKYKGLPYVMLDYPRCFSTTDIFAIRTFFWWGNFFSVTLHLKGKYIQQFVPLLQKNQALLRDAGFQLSISGDEWEHDINTGYFSPLPVLSTPVNALEITSAAFYKLGCAVPFSKWNDVRGILSGLHELIFRAITV